jgi:sulfur-oxidizing protein SoxY
MLDRRELLARGAAVTGLLAMAGLLPATAQAAWNTAAFEAKNPADVYKGLGVAAPTASSEVTLTGPEIAENGAVVPVVVSSTAPDVKRLLILIDKNPNTLAAAFDISDAMEPSVSTRVKMAQTSNVYAVAVKADGKLIFAHKEIKVTLGGCGG